MKNDTRTKGEVIKEIETISQQPGFIYSLVIMLRQDQFITLGEKDSVNLYKQLSFQEFSFLIGLMIKKKISLEFISKEVITSNIKKIYQLFEELHRAYNEPFVQKMIQTVKRISPDTSLNKGETREEAFQDFFKSGQLMAEPIFYSDSGAYDFQFWELAPIKYGSDSHWLGTRGINLNLCIQITLFLKKFCEFKLSKFEVDKKDFKAYCETMLSIFCFTEDDLKSFNKKGVSKFLEFFSLKDKDTGVNEALTTPGEYNLLESHPIIEIADDKFFLPISFNLSRSIYESPFYWMNSDEKYKDTASVHRGKVTVDIACTFLSKVFGKENVFRDVQIMKSGKNITDIDLLVLFKNKAVIFQIKSKRLTTLSKVGNDEALEIDFKKAVQDAYVQAIKSRNAVLSRDVKFISSTGKELQLNEAINDAYIICLTTDDYPGLQVLARSYLKKELNDPYPILLNIFDLEIILFYLNDPFEFLYYLRQRVLTYEYFFATGEMSYLGWHLKKKLFKMPGYDKASIDNTFASDIDQNYPVLRGYHPSTEPKKKLGPSWSNPKYQEIIDSVKNTQSPGFVDAVFELYDTSGEAADQLVELIESTKKKSLKDGKNHDFSLIYDNNKAGLSYISQFLSSPDLLTSIMNLAVARKYKTKADRWLGLISRSDSPKLVECAVFNMQSWKPNPKLEALQSVMLRPGMFINARKVGRNDPCICGSGRKYKKCCLGRLS